MQNRVSQELVAPPEEILIKIYEAAKIGDIEAIEKDAEAVNFFNPQYRNFANRVLELVAEFEDAEILKLVEVHLKN